MKTLGTLAPDARKARGAALNVLKDEIAAALDARKNDLSKTVSDMDTERGQEASLRETFGVARPGEDVIIVVPKTETTPPPQLTLWQKIKAFFGF